MRFTTPFHILAAFLFYSLSHFTITKFEINPGKFPDFVDQGSTNLTAEELFLFDIEIPQDDTTEINTQKRLELAVQNKNWSAASLTCYDLARHYNDHLRFDEGLQVNLKGITYAQNAGNTNAEAKNLFGLGVNYFSKFD